MHTHKYMYYIIVYIHMYGCVSIHKYIPYSFVLKPGSTNTCRVVQQYEWNKCLGSFKCWVPKLLNSTNSKWCHALKMSIFSICLSTGFTLTLYM